MSRKTKLGISQLNLQQDFTTLQYAQLLRLAKVNYKFIGYQEIAYFEKFVIWRHDCDYSLNRSLRLAQIEHQELVKATYFLNPHCEFYNLLEKDQAQKVREILALGHDIGLHFDPAFYDIHSEDKLDALVESEANWLEEWFGVRPVSFSFHNPTDFLLSCDKDIYGGLINCYSKTFKTKIRYCSDSNGYWRFGHLRDVLESAKDTCLQVLTHPGWWQEVEMYPRERIFRSAYGRASAIMNLYDTGLETNARENLAGPAGNLKFLKVIDIAHFELCDYLWNGRRLDSLFIELYRLFQFQTKHFCIAVFQKKWSVSQVDLKLFFEDAELSINGTRLFQLVFGKSSAQAIGSSEDELIEWAMVFDQLLNRSANIPYEKLEEGCIYLCGALKGLAQWGHESIGYDGISDLGEIGNPSNSVDQGDGLRLDKVEGSFAPPDDAWKDFLIRAKIVSRVGYGH